MDVDAALSDRYEVVDHGSVFHVYCRVCGQGWEIPKVIRNPGAVLRLLDHSYSHEEEDDEAS